MTVNSNSIGIYGSSNGALTIYGQTRGTGTLNVTGTDYGIWHDHGNVVICGGKVTATGGNRGIRATGDVTITGGQVTAICGDYFNCYGIISGNGNITLGCTSVADYIKLSSYKLNSGSGSVNIADGQTLDAEGSGRPISGNNTDVPNGATLHPLEYVLSLDDAADNSAAIIAANDDWTNWEETRNVILYGRTLYKDGAWNTLCLPFDLVLEGSPLDGDGVDVRTLSSSDFQDGTLTFTNAGAVTTLQAGQPYIIKWNDTGKHLTDNDLVFLDAEVSAAAPATVSTDCVDFCGTYAPQPLYESGDAKHNLYLGADNTLYYPTAEGFHVNAFRGYFQLKNGLTAGEPSSAHVRAFSLNFDGDEHTGIESLTPDPFPKGEGSIYWYSLDGRRLSGKPTARGIYIRSTSGSLQDKNNAKKVVIK